MRIERPRNNNAIVIGDNGYLLFYFVISGFCSYPLIIESNWKIKIDVIQKFYGICILFKKCDFTFKLNESKFYEEIFNYL